MEHRTYLGIRDIVQAELAAARVEWMKEVDQRIEDTLRYREREAAVKAYFENNGGD